jgi:hypothetical protein
VSDTSELRIPSEYCAASSERFATGETEVIELPPPRAPWTVPWWGDWLVGSMAVVNIIALLGGWYG